MKIFVTTRKFHILSKNSVPSMVEGSFQINEVDLVSVEMWKGVSFYS